MKTFFVALGILTVVTGFVIWNTIDLQKTFREMLTLTEALPTESADFKKDAATEAVMNRLWTLWDKKFTRIVFTSGYENCNRADEAIAALYVHFKNGNADDFTHARLLFWDSLLRLKMLESFGFDSLF